MFPSVRRTIYLLARTPLVPPQPTGPAPIELSSFSSSLSQPSTNSYESGPSRSNRPRAASRTVSNMSVKSGYGLGQIRGYADEQGKGKKELYSEEQGSLGASIDDVAHTDAAYDSNADPKSAAKKVENESGKDFTNQSAPNPNYSNPPGKQGEEQADSKPLNTSRKESGKM